MMQIVKIEVSFKYLECTLKGKLTEEI